MFTLLNRLRGTYGYFAKINAILLGLLFYYVTKDWQISLMVGLGYLVGESFGWGEWIGTIITERDYCKDCDEGRSNGIYYITRLFANPDTEWYKFSQFALAIRGFYWWFLTYASLMFLPYANYRVILLIVFALSVAFPLCIELSKRYSLNFRWKFLSVSGAWETQEVYYGVVQDIALAIIIWSIV